MAISANSKKVLKYLQEHPTENITAKALAATLGLSDKTVNACFTSSIQKKELGYREPVTVKAEAAEGVEVEVTYKYLRLNEAGMAYDPDAQAETAE